MNTVRIENAETTIALRAVATVETVFLIPHFARIEAMPARIAESKA